MEENNKDEQRETARDKKEQDELEALLGCLPSELLDPSAAPDWKEIARIVDEMDGKI